MKKHYDANSQQIPTWKIIAEDVADTAFIYGTLVGTLAVIALIAATLIGTI